MKKMKLALLVLLSIIVLAGCGKSAKEEFFDAAKKTATESSSNDFSMKIKDIKLTSDMSGDPSVNAMVTQLKDIKVNGSIQQDVKEKLSATDLKIEALGQKLPLSFISKNDDMYLSLDILKGIANISTQFGASLPFDELTFKEVEGKYINISEKNELDIDTKNAKSFGKDYQVSVTKYFDSLSEERFTKKDDVVTFSITKKDIVELAKEYNKVAKSKKSYAEYVIPDLDKVIKSLPKNITLKINNNTKSQASDMTMLIEFDKNEQVPIKSVELLYTLKPNDKKVAIKVPAKKNIMTMDEVSELLAATEESQLNASYDDVKIDDAEFNQLLEAITTEDLSALTKNDIDSLLANYKEILTPKQYKAMEKALLENK